MAEYVEQTNKKKKKKKKEAGEPQFFLLLVSNTYYRVTHYPVSYSFPRILLISRFRVLLGFRV